MIRSGTVDIAAHDHGGDGMPILLLHGAGGDMRVWDTIAPLLPGRVLAMDLRGHGRSGDGPWDWEAVLDDLEAVTDHFGLSAPAVVGHSLGGMLAGMWARRHPECPGTVSLDGHRAAATHPSNYAGMPGERVEEDLRKLSAVFTAQEKMMTETGARPNPDITATLRKSDEFADSLPIFAEVVSPFLIVMATKNLPGLPPDFAELMDAYRAGLRRDLATLTARRPNISVRELDASHAMVVEQPDHLAEIITDFLR
jgi:pimeloyl-ACP methyl ester carboxylesterase